MNMGAINSLEMPIGMSNEIRNADELLAALILSWNIVLKGSLWENPR